MSTGAAAVAISTAAMAQAESARKEACASFMRNYKHDAATVAEVRHYASCAERMYPEALTPDAVVAGKVAVALLILSFIGGGIHGLRRGSEFMDVVMYAIGGVVLCTLGLMAVAGLYLGTKFLLS